MQIIISNDALDWFKKEMEVMHGEAVRFFVRYGGSSKLQPGFSLGVTKDQPREIGVQLERDHVVYFIEKNDIWYFDEHNLEVSVNDDLHELEYSYIK
ncbi:HesB/YadR/YfhF family protein [Planococcus versutus]|uniref:FeS cluster biogenesis domain-containing protein n=1 Tax=Planococcus versutus TaxID=1302659 RepID=A0A1B1S5L6_9BACL|nr:HesB/YadR/YfhF family protein [Planococcus versutus]ANU28480.1 hypothetical protein I858_015940 [Planococcus versutus]